MQAFVRWRCSSARCEMVPSLTVTCTCTDSWTFKCSFCLFEVLFTIYVLRKSDNWTKSKLKIYGDDSSCNVFFLLAFRPNCCETFTFVLFSEGCFPLMTCSCFEFIFFLVPCSALTQLLKQFSFCLGHTFLL